MSTVYFLGVRNEALAEEEEPGEVEVDLEAAWVLPAAVSPSGQ